MAGKFRIFTVGEPSAIRGQDVRVEYIDADGVKHPIQNCKAAKVIINNRLEPVELHLCIVGNMEIDIEADIAATFVKRDPGPINPTGRSYRWDPPIQNIPLKKK